MVTTAASARDGYFITAWCRASAMFWLCVSVRRRSASAGVVRKEISARTLGIAGPNQDHERRLLHAEIAGRGVGRPQPRHHRFLDLAGQVAGLVQLVVLSAIALMMSGRLCIGPFRGRVLAGRDRLGVRRWRQSSRK